MVSMAAAVIAAGITHALPQQDGWFTVGEITAYGQTDPDSRTLPAVNVPIRFPVEAPAPAVSDAPYVQWGEWKVEINQWGNIGRAYKATGGWEEFKSLYADAQRKIAEGKAKVWKIKCVIFRRTNVLHKDRNGILHTQRAYLNTPEERFCLETFARFGALVEAFSQGAVDVQLTFSLEEEPVSGFYENNELWTLDPRDAGERYLRGRFNRGDFDGLIYMFHPGLTNSFSFGGMAGRINNAPAAYVIHSNGRERGFRISHTEAMLHEWFHEVEDTYALWGYGAVPAATLPNLHGGEENGYAADSLGYSGWFVWMRDLMMRAIRPAMWARMSNREEPDWQQALTVTRPYSGDSYQWHEVEDDCWAKLPYLTASDIKTRYGLDSFSAVAKDALVAFVPLGRDVKTGIRTQPSHLDSTLDNQLNFEREAVARITIGDRDVLFIRWDAVDFVLDNLPGAASNVIGYFSADSRLVVVCEMSHSNQTTSELNLLSLGSGNVKTSVIGGGDFTRDQKPSVRFVSSIRGGPPPNVRYTVASWDGTAVQVGDNGEVDAPPGGPGVRVLRVTAVSEDGARSERPIVVRWADPVQVDLKPHGTSLITSSSHPMLLEVRNGGSPRDLDLAASLPSGWELSGLPSAISLAPYESKAVDLVLRVGPGEDGPVSVALDVSVARYDGPAITKRVSLNRVSRSVLLESSFEDGPDHWGEPRADGGDWATEIVETGFKGRCLKVTDQGGVRWGRVNALGSNESGKPPSSLLGYAAADYPFLDFYLNTSRLAPLGLLVTLESGERFAVMLVGEHIDARSDTKELERAKFVPNGTWQRVVYNLDAKLKHATGRDRNVVVDIALGDTRLFVSNQTQDANRASFMVDEFRIAREADESLNTSGNDLDQEVNLSANPMSESELERAYATTKLVEGASEAAIKPIRDLLLDKSPLVRLNAAKAFSQFKDAQATKLLIDNLLTEPDPTVMAYMVKALVNQNTVEAWKVFEQLPTIGRRDEEGIREAIKQMGIRNEESQVRSVGLAITGTSWQTRLEGARALGRMTYQRAKLDQMTFLFETDPHVRIEVGKSADVGVDLVRRRMEWGSINDLSSIARAYAYGALTRSGDPVIRSRGYSGLREPDADIRQIVATVIGNDPNEHHVPILVEVLKDSNPYVRSAAVEALLNMPGEITWQRFQVLDDENYEQVLLPLLESAKVGKLTLPGTFLERLSKHRNGDIARRALEVLGR